MIGRNVMTGGVILLLVLLLSLPAFSRPGASQHTGKPTGVAVSHCSSSFYHRELCLLPWCSVGQS